jgi:hypothetical protein
MVGESQTTGATLNDLANEVNTRPVFAAKRIDTSPVTDDLRATAIANLMDNINLAWNGWEMACNFEDDKLQAYYMKYVRDFSALLEKVKKYS